MDYPFNRHASGLYQDSLIVLNQKTAYFSDMASDVWLFSKT